MKILIVGGGGREHALSWKCAQSPLAEEVFVAPGNAGTGQEDQVTNVAISAEDTERLLAFALDSSIDLTIVGPEVPLVSGIVDRFSEHGLACFGPTAAAARLEGSKSFAKEFMHRNNIDSARFETFDSAKEAQQYIRSVGVPIVVKADGLAAGKGVTVAFDQETALAAVSECLDENRFGSAGARVIIEDYLQGEEVSFICMVDGKNVLPLASSQDHKARDDGDRGPNTGGMGAYSPAPVITESIHDRIMDEVINPTVSGLIAEGMPYSGFLYAGLMITETNEIKVLEYNCRFGDPETQPVLMRMNSDLVTLCVEALAVKLDQSKIEWDPRVALGVVMTSGGYPDAYEKGRVIEGLPLADSDIVKTFHAGTRLSEGDVVTDGGRVLCVTALGESASDAQQSAYEAVSGIHWDDVYYRTDIGYKAIAREESDS